MHTSDPNPVQSFEKISRIYSERREKEIAIRISWDVVVDKGCKLVSIKAVEDLDV